VTDETRTPVRPDETRDPTYRQMVQILECDACGWSKGRSWAKDDVVFTAEPCERHLRMLERLGWTET
jgi:hypothetical protein